jgi:hypothetical protein
MKDEIGRSALLLPGGAHLEGPALLGDEDQAGEAVLLGGESAQGGGGGGGVVGADAGHADGDVIRLPGRAQADDEVAGRLLRGRCVATARII